MIHEVILLTGSNQGDRLDQLQNCNLLLQQYVGDLLCISKVYESEAWGKEAMPPHLNQAIWMTTDLSPNDLLKSIKTIERQLGRVPTEKWGLRAIDIDIIFYDNIHLQSENLNIPHLWMQERKFVLIPIQEIAANWMHPVFQKNVQQLLQECKDPLWVHPFNESKITDQ